MCSGLLKGIWCQPQCKHHTLSGFLEANICFFKYLEAIWTCTLRHWQEQRQDKNWDDCFETWDWIMGNVSVQGIFENTFWFRSYLCLHHRHPVWSHFGHQPQDVDKLMIPNVLQEPVQGNECSSPADSGAAKECSDSTFLTRPFTRSQTHWPLENPQHEIAALRKDKKYSWRYFPDFEVCECGWHWFFVFF